MRAAPPSLLKQAAFWPMLGPGRMPRPQIGPKMLNRKRTQRAGTDDRSGEDDIELPVVWLLGKTGAGKSSLVRALTEATDAEIGNGFQPCTRTALAYDFPPERPLVRFLDTRGLGEAGYDPADDLQACRDRGHVLLVVCRIDDPVQGMVAEALSAITGADSNKRVILVRTGLDLVPDPEAKERAERSIHTTMSRAAGQDLAAVSIALPQAGAEDAAGMDALRGALLDALPAAGLLLEKAQASTAEQIEFLRHKRRVLRYAAAAMTSDLAPVVGLVGVPATQMKMLHELGRLYGVTWDRTTGAAFLGTMGASLGTRYAATFGLRQLSKLIPVYGQTVGAAAAGAVSFATTYALGRAAAYFLYRTSRDSPPTEAELREVYQRAFRRSSDAAD